MSPRPSHEDGFKKLFKYGEKVRKLVQFGGGNGREVLIRTVFQDAVNKCESSQLASLLEKIRAVLDDVSASQDDKNDKRKIKKDRGTTPTETPVREVSNRRH